MTICGARNRKGSCCGNIPMQNGRCRMHGGKSKGPNNPAKLHGNLNAVGNKSKLSTGEFEIITWDRLTDTEKEWLTEQYRLKPNEFIDDPLEMEFIRVARMLGRMNELDKDMNGNFDDLIRLEHALTRVQMRIARMITGKRCKITTNQREPGAMKRNL
ncbi:HGGxSTG domain-containing protein [Paenibacillus oryzisoli]|nr:HGGxSTG domain-containing protein [Paenibacillus oryzisoli]